MAEGTENPVIDAGQFLGEDGAFSENWLDQAYGEDDPLRNDPTLKNTKGVRSMASQLVNSQKQLGQLSSGRDFAILPNEQSDEAEIKEYRTKIGVPESGADYKLNEMQLPEGLGKDDKLAEHMAEVLHKSGTPAKQAAAIYNGYTEYMKTAMEAVATQEKLDDAAANKELRGKLGATYDDTLKNIAAVVNAFGNAIDPAETANLIKDLPNDSFAAQLLGKMAEKLVAEKGLTIEPTVTDGSLTPANAMEKFNELTKDPYYLTASPQDKPRNLAYHEELVRKGTALMELATSKGGA